MSTPRPGELRRGFNSAVSGASKMGRARLPGRPWARGRGDAGKQDGENAGEKDAVESSRAANRGDWRAKATDLVEIKKIGANQRSHRAADIGKWRRVLAGQDKCKDYRDQDGRKYRHSDTDARHGRGHHMDNKSDCRGSDGCLEPELISDDEIGGHDRRNHRAADIDGKNGTGP